MTIRIRRWHWAVALIGFGLFWLLVHLVMKDTSVRLTHRVPDAEVQQSFATPATQQRSSSEVAKEISDSHSPQSEGQSTRTIELSIVAVDRATGEPLQNAVLSLIEGKESLVPRSGVPTSRTDLNGKAVIRVARKAWESITRPTLHGYHEGHMQVLHDVDESSARTPSIQTLVEFSRGLHITGRVVSPGGSGVGGVAITARGPGADGGSRLPEIWCGVSAARVNYGASVTDSTGRFTLSGLVAGTVRVGATKRGWSISPQDRDNAMFRPGDPHALVSTEDPTETVLVMEPVWRLCILGMDAHTGRPVQGLNVRLSVGQRSPWRLCPANWWDWDGPGLDIADARSFWLIPSAATSDVPTEVVRAHVQALGYTPVSVDVTPQRLDEVNGLEPTAVTLQPETKGFGSLVLDVSIGDQGLYEGPLVVSLSPTQTSLRSTLAAVEVKSTFNGVRPPIRMPAGQYRLGVMGTDVFRAFHDPNENRLIEIRAGETTTAGFSLQAGTVEVVVESIDGTRLPGATLELALSPEQFPSRIWGATLRHEGNELARIFRSSPSESNVGAGVFPCLLSPGDYVASVHCFGFGPSEKRSFGLQVGDRIRVTFVLEPE